MRDPLISREMPSGGRLAHRKMHGGLKLGVSRLAGSAEGRYQRASARLLCQRPFVINPGTPIISFTLDDFPRSALLIGGALLESFGLAGTYCTSLGLIGAETPTGTMFVEEDLKAVVEGGHELGCHTFGHCHSWHEPACVRGCGYRESASFAETHSGASFETLSYPISVPRAQTKRRVSKYFACCRCGGQTFNIGKVDLNYLSGYFLEQSRDNPDGVRHMIDENRQAGGWLSLRLTISAKTRLPGDAPLTSLKRFCNIQ